MSWRLVRGFCIVEKECEALRMRNGGIMRRNVEWYCELGMETRGVKKNGDKEGFRFHCLCSGPVSLNQSLVL